MDLFSPYTSVNGSNFVLVIPSVSSHIRPLVHTVSFPHGAKYDSFVSALFFLADRCVDLLVPFGFEKGCRWGPFTFFLSGLSLVDELSAAEACIIVGVFT